MNEKMLAEITQTYANAIDQIQKTTGVQVGFILATAATDGDRTLVMSASNLDAETAEMIVKQAPSIARDQSVQDEGRSA